MIHLAVASVSQACSQVTASKGSSSILDPIAKPIADVLAFFYSLVPNYAVAILLLSLVWMVLISPLTLKTTRSMLAMQKLQPEMKRLQEKHRNDRQALAAAQMQLYKTHNVSPFGSCLPSILPLPVFFALFRVIDDLSHHTTVHTAAGAVSCATPKYLSHTTAMYAAIVKADGKLSAFGLDLAKSALSSHSSVLAALPFFALLLIMMGTQYLQTAQMMSRNPAAQQNSQMAIMKYLPLFFGLICIRFPAGVVLYYAMSNACRIVQQDLMYRFDPKVKTLAIRDVVEIEAKAGVTDDDQAGLFSRRKPATSPSSRMRFRDLLGSAIEQQSAAGGPADTGGPPTPKGNGSPRSTTDRPARSGRAPGGRASESSGVPSRGGRNPRQVGAGKKAPNGSASAPAATGRGPDSADGQEEIPNPSPRRRDRGAGGSARKDEGPGPAGDATPPNGKPAGPPRPPQPRTGAGAGRTGAAGNRTGAQGSRNRRRGK